VLRVHVSDGNGWRGGVRRADAAFWAVWCHSYYI
jgi:hypothetical protein